ncbi:DUF1642 domain-containing protein [Enterococcus faecalis]|uniref:DUF1642 domain-containing protein n=1 Tax=Enterococcus TaxID=1350 RepID=UPI000F809683|nr:DUF1642 domain-containing protein [Enterococcus faecalis]EIP8061252.1 DUF1642 domain-containing protein [Enterococcus faecalis]EKL7625114.1 DUF1642 domain-containing protein [Enterococcus faecalis]EKZ0110800.1 DUF1642 domain-containing protein [Enterococcus faecalis]RTK50126.1 hypothetical protein DRJ88_08175 [Enterococcus faecalis]HAP3790315.1 DUF1642 domain-containing protein [Enterococcus faecalis]
MDKQELIEELECLEVPTDSYNYLRGANYAVEKAISLAKQLDEPKKVKVVVPQVVADWIKYAKQQGYGFMQSYDPKKMFYPINDGLDKWIDEHEETFAHAWLDGYEVMKEPLYYVKLPEIGYMRFGFCIPVTESIEEAKKYTEQEIKAIDERYWPFAVKVEEA